MSEKAARSEVTGDLGSFGERRGFDFLYTKNFARPRSDFTYTKNFARSGSDFIYTKNFLRKIMKTNDIFKNFPRCARQFVKNFRGAT